MGEKSPKKNLRKNEKFITISKPENDQKVIEAEKTKTEVCDETTSDNNDDPDEFDKDEHRELLQTAAESISKKHGKMMRKIYTFNDDIERLIEIQGEQRRLRNRRLYDSNDAVEIMEGYRKVKKKKNKTKYTIKRLQVGTDPFKFQLIKKKSDPRKVIYDESKPF